ncbi:hypothetical protein [Agriterribacter sp.]|uniref:hypothetical protein n=1 Tax=Agriterribacter sp. TaxID=2821509 RepID=UPI002BC16BEE|nr:hypothetical protein [Agriterribacter sp.]HRP57057.1 hypothetical protein [Agriterribacter sp.]
MLIFYFSCMNDNNDVYSIPGRFRRIENLHILLWLLKDICWALDFHVTGMIMIVPTLTVAITITWQTRKLIAELLHNLAVVLWITANCLWMTGEFYGWDEGTWGARHLALIPFSTGLCVLAYYYLFLGHKKNVRKQMILKAEELVREEQV